LLLFLLLSNEEEEQGYERGKQIQNTNTTIPHRTVVVDFFFPYQKKFPPNNPDSFDRSSAPEKKKRTRKKTNKQKKNTKPIETQKSECWSMPNRRNAESTKPQTARYVLILLVAFTRARYHQDNNNKQ